jgi:protein SCO1/2
VHVPIEKGPRLPSGGYEVTHGTPVLGVTPDGSVPVLWTEGTSAAKLAEDIDTILTEGIPSTDGAG